MPQIDEKVPKTYNEIIEKKLKLNLIEKIKTLKLKQQIVTEELETLLKSKICVQPSQNQDIAGNPVKSKKRRKSMIIKSKKIKRKKKMRRSDYDFTNNYNDDEDASKGDCVTEYSNILITYNNSQKKLESTS